MSAESKNWGEKMYNLIDNIKMKNIENAYKEYNVYISRLTQNSYAARFIYDKHASSWEELHDMIFTFVETYPGKNELGIYEIENTLNFLKQREKLEKSALHALMPEAFQEWRILFPSKALKIVAHILDKYKKESDTPLGKNIIDSLGEVQPKKWSMESLLKSLLSIKHSSEKNGWDFIYDDDFSYLCTMIDTVKFMQTMPNFNLYQICECCWRIATSVKSRQKTLLCPYHRKDATAYKRMLKLRKVLDGTGGKARELDDVILNRAMKKSRALRESGFKAFLLRSLPLEYESMLRESPFPAELCERIRQEPPDLRTTSLFPAVFPCISAFIVKFDGDIRSPESILRTLEEPPYVPACQDSCLQKLREEMYLIGSRDLAAYRDMLCHAEAWLEAAQQYPRLTKYPHI